MIVSVDKLIKAYRFVGREPFKYNPAKPYDLNLIGIRSEDMTPNVFNDCLGVLWEDKYGWNWIGHEGTTDPGSFYLQNPENVNGTFIMAPGFYQGLWKWGFHKGYPALQQVKGVRGWRDSDRDNEFDMNPANIIDVGVIGANMHKAGKYSKRVDKWSAGCQVRAKENDHLLLGELIKTSLKYWNNSFSYMLFTENQLG